MIAATDVGNVRPLNEDSVRIVPELDIAVELNKRLIPLIHRDVDPASVPDSLASLNWVPFQDSDDFDQAFDDLTYCAAGRPGRFLGRPRRLIHFCNLDGQARRGSGLGNPFE